MCLRPQSGMDLKHRTDSVLFSNTLGDWHVRFFLQENRILCRNWPEFLFLHPVQVSRGVAQPGSAPRSGRGGRRFESCRPDHTGQRDQFDLFFLRLKVRFETNFKGFAIPKSPKTGSNNRYYNQRHAMVVMIKHFFGSILSDQTPTGCVSDSRDLRAGLKLLLSEFT
jgi:hypothetical protein